MYSLFDKKRKQEIRDAVKRRDKAFFRSRKSGLRVIDATEHHLEQYDRLALFNERLKASSVIDSASERHPTKYNPRQIDVDLLIAIRKEDMEGVKSAIRSGADITGTFPTDIIEERSNFSSWYVENPLGMAMRYGHNEIIDFLKMELVKASRD